MSVDGTPKFSSLVVREISAEISVNSITLTGKAAFFDKTSGANHAWTKGEGAIWSKATIEQLQLLASMMEVDLARLHFHGGQSASPLSRGFPSAEPSGLMEHLGEADQA
jgi:hypothetical protein